MRYEDCIFIRPIENANYEEVSNKAVTIISQIIQKTIDTEENRVIINTNLTHGLPIENINKIGGPILEAWAFEIFEKSLEDSNFRHYICSVDAQTRRSISDVNVTLNINGIKVVCHIDVKATSNDIVKSGKAPNITSFSKIRSEYVTNKDFIFLILSLKYRVTSSLNGDTSLVDGVMEITDFSVFDFKFVKESDLTYNPALGTGQMQIKDIHKVGKEIRTTWELIQLLDKKYLNSSKRSFKQWLDEGVKCGWIEKN